jgi:peptide/nickel transport system substrate-binding protein
MAMNDETRRMLSRRDLLVLSGGAAALPMLRPELAMGAPPQVLRIAMTAADLPATGGIPNNGFEGYRFLGYTAYDALVNWDFTHTNQIAGITPGLFSAWQTPTVENPLRWVFTVREGVKFHDGSDMDADAIMFNLDRTLSDKAPNYDGPAAPIVKATISMLDKYEKVDDKTIAMTTLYPFSWFPFILTRVLIVSPAQYAKVGKNWQAFAKSPSGTGPFKITKVVANQYAELSRNPDYWDKGRVPRLDKMVVYPMPEATTRMAALRSGQVDWIEVPPPDGIDSLKAAGFNIVLWPYPHIWPYVLNTEPGSPFADKRVRQAANYAIDREGLCKLLNNTAVPATGFYPEDNPIFGKPTQHYTYDPAKARQLLKDAGYGPDKPLKAKIMISTSCSGQMVPLPMNEFLQQNFQAAGMQIDFDVVEWGTVIIAIRSDPKAPPSHGDDGVNMSLGATDDSTMWRFFDSVSFSPKNYNWGHYKNPEVDKLIDAALATFDHDEQVKLLSQAHAMVVDDAPWVWIVHDLNPRTMSKKVQGFKPAQSWFQDFTHITMSAGA